MDMRRLEIFYRVIEEGGFTKAARVMSLTQPTLSEAVRLLEEELGTQLLNRQGRVILPTDSGRLLQGYAKKIFSLRQEAEADLKSLSAGEHGELVLGGSTVPGTYLLPSLVAEFRCLYPQIGVSLQIASTAKMVEGLRHNQLELALVGGELRDKTLEAVPCFGDELILIVAPGHAWTGREYIAEIELLKVPLLLREQGSATRKLFEEHLKSHGKGLLPENLIAEVGGNEALKQGVLAGLGVAVISKLAVAGELQRGELIALQLVEGPLRRSFYLVQAKGFKLSVAAQRFKALVLAKGQAL
ncbi:selenium metabolism-associated LysR family transcriptional regulator [Geopsychrobacter electrodiphilus]|uniref:selenium metabolism-associated LysR family transcriptional regulator n=1 Tax=Geopsychrobacter electrodiphilus TaxID=225196 RepID=UPI000375C221|nr:selenium metabolism-associated LysR family transcriptional regulator [Geopsychrobacter electrodiphilus]